MAAPGEYQRLSEDYLGQAAQDWGRGESYGQDVYGFGQGLGSTYNAFQPVLKNLPGQTKLDKEALVSQASTDTSLAFDKSQGAMTRNMSRMGVSPNSGRFGGLEQQWGLARAAAEAGAKSRARKMVREEEWARSLAASNVGLNLSSQSVNARNAGANMMDVAGNRRMALAGAQDKLATEAQAAQDAERLSFQQQLDQRLAQMAENATRAKVEADVVSSRISPAERARLVRGWDRFSNV